LADFLRGPVGTLEWAECVDDELDEVDLALVSAAAMPAPTEAIADPIPSATASAPIRPT
jgi:hypothetical protein